MQQLVAAAHDAHGEQSEAAHDHRDRQSRPAREHPARTGVQQDVGGQRQNAPLRPKLNDVVVQMRDAKSRRVVLAIERIDLFDIRRTDAQQRIVFDDLDAGLNHPDAVEIR